MNRSVVIIDDNMEILELLTEYLFLQYFDVVACGTDGLQAVNLYAEHTPDFVIMDVAMPGYDGIYGLENIKKLNPNATIIMHTGNTDELINKKMIQLNATEILRKPCPVEKLVSVMKSIKNSAYNEPVSILA